MVVERGDLWKRRKKEENEVKTELRSSVTSCHGHQKDRQPPLHDVPESFDAAVDKSRYICYKELGSFLFILTFSLNKI